MLGATSVGLTASAAAARSSISGPEHADERVPVPGSGATAVVVAVDVRVKPRQRLRDSNHSKRLVCGQSALLCFVDQTGDISDRRNRHSPNKFNSGA